MHPSIKEQKRLMEEALDTLKSIQLTKNLFKGVDEAYRQQQVKELQQQYADTMASLASNLVPEEFAEKLQAIPY